MITCYEVFAFGYKRNTCFGMRLPTPETVNSTFIPYTFHIHGQKFFLYIFAFSDNKI